MQGIAFRPFILVKQHPHKDRTDIIKLFVDKLNLERKGTKYKPLSFIAVSNKLAGFQDNENGTAQLHAFLCDCEKSNIGFSRYFFWKLKI